MKQNAEIIGEGGAGNWHALFTRHQHEKSIANSLSHKGFEVYLPLYRAVHRWQDRAKQVSLPLFSCYVFIHGGMNRQSQILATPGVLYIVGWGGRPAIIPQAQLDAVRQMIDSSLHIEPHAFLQNGERVRVITGPLYGLEGMLERKKGTNRLVVSIEMLGRAAAVEIAISDVVRIDRLLPETLTRPITAVV